MTGSIRSKGVPSLNLSLRQALPSFAKLRNEKYADPTPAVIDREERRSWRSHGHLRQHVHTLDALEDVDIFGRHQPVPVW